MDSNRFTKIIPASGKWYLRVHPDLAVNVAGNIYPIAAWAECAPDGKIIGLSTVYKSDLPELMGPPPGFKCEYVTEEQLTNVERVKLAG